LGIIYLTQASRRPEGPTQNSLGCREGEAREKPQDGEFEVGFSSEGAPQTASRPSPSPVAQGVSLLQSWIAATPQTWGFVRASPSLHPRLFCVGPSGLLEACVKYIIPKILSCNFFSFSSGLCVISPLLPIFHRRDAEGDADGRYRLSPIAPLTSPAGLRICASASPRWAGRIENRSWLRPRSRRPGLGGHTTSLPICLESGPPTRLDLAGCLFWPR